MLRIRISDAVQPLRIPWIVGALVAGVVGSAFAIGKVAAARVQYFPHSYFEASVVCDRGGGPGKGPVIGDIEADWYPQHWRAAGEPSLYLASLKDNVPEVASWRFTWLRTFHHPVIVRIDEMRNGSLRLTAKELSGHGGYDPGQVTRQVSRVLTRAEAARLQAALSSTRVFTLPPRDCQRGNDGAEWLLERNNDAEYRFVGRWTPEGGPVREVGMLFLSLTGWKLDPVY